MNSHDAVIDYSEPIAGGKTRICIDIFPAIPQSFGEEHDAMVKHFGMVESDEVRGLMTLRAESDQASFLAFFGTSWEEALGRWPRLAFFHDYRLQHGRDAYASLEDWQAFYELVAAGVEPARITVAFIEHY